MYQTSIFIYRRDLRLQDNTGLLHALAASEQVIPAFFIDSRQVGDENKYRGEKLLQFMTESLEDLNESLERKGSRLFLFYGELESELAKVIDAAQIEAVYINKDYTPFSLKRDKSIEKLCKAKGIDFYSFDDANLAPPGSVLKDDSTPYSIFTPFYKKAIKTTEVLPPKRNRHDNYFSGKLQGSLQSPRRKIYFTETDKLFINGGRAQALKLLKRVKTLGSYKAIRDIPAEFGTTGLSAHHKFGTISPRETYKAAADSFGKDCQLIREIYWRDFFTQIAFHYPHIFKGAFRKQYDAIEWENDRKLFDAWREGRTGYPLVDAGMRELLETGYMHNRVRMVTASFLVKDLLISWRWGERWFAQQLIDYDPAVNNGNWQWAASTGCDAQPYFRIFNPWLQQKKFDADCEYIKRWVPELKTLDPKQIHKFETNPMPMLYPAPIVDHYERKEEALFMFEEVRKNAA